jgi:hypothetical protein
MAYPKITVNTSKALAVIASDSIPIPSPNAQQLVGVTSAATTDKLVAVGSDFSNVVIGDIVYNTTDNTVATVTELILQQYYQLVLIYLHLLKILLYFKLDHNLNRE